MLSSLSHSSTPHTILKKHGIYLTQVPPVVWQAMEEFPHSPTEFEAQFETEEDWRDYLFHWRWPGGFHSVSVRRNLPRLRATLKNETRQAIRRARDGHDSRDRSSYMASEGCSASLRAFVQTTTRTFLTEGPSQFFNDSPEHRLPPFFKDLFPSANHGALM